MASEESGVQTSPYRLQEWYDMHMEYITAQHLRAGIAARYNFRKGMYIEAEGTVVHGFGLRHIDESGRYNAGLAVGVTF